MDPHGEDWDDDDAMDEGAVYALARWSRGGARVPVDGAADPY